MAETLQQSDGRPEHPSVQFEVSDASFSWIMALLLGAIVLAVLLLAAVLWFFLGYRNYQARIKQSAFPLAATPSTALPPEPRLEQLDRLAGIVTPNAHLDERRAGSENLQMQLDSMGPTDEEGFVHIPIERAMSLLANKLPARGEPPAEGQRRAGGLLDAGAPNSGREFQRRP